MFTPLYACLEGPRKRQREPSGPGSQPSPASSPLMKAPAAKRARRLSSDDCESQPQGDIQADTVLKEKLAFLQEAFPGIKEEVYWWLYYN